MSLNVSVWPGGERRALNTLRLYLALIAGLWSLSVLPLLLRSARLWPTRPLWEPPPFFDFGCYYERLALLGRPEFWTAPVGPSWDYPAPAVFVYRLFYAFNRGSGGPHKVFFGFLAYLVFAAAVLLLAALLIAKAMQKRGVSRWNALLFLAPALVLCWPLYFGMQRGNIEFFLEAGIAAGLWAYARRRWWVAAVLLGAFGTGKLYPLIFLLLLLPVGKWKQFLLGICVAAVVSITATHWIGPPPTGTTGHANGVLAGLNDWLRSNSLSFVPEAMGYDHSLFGFLKAVNRYHPERFFTLCLASVAFGSIAALALGLRVWRMPRLNQLLLVACVAVLLPPTSYDYTLGLLVPAFIWVVLAALDKGPLALGSPPMRLVIVLFAVLFAPEAFFYWNGFFFAGQFKMLCLAALVGFAVWKPLDVENPNVESPNVESTGAAAA